MIRYGQGICVRIARFGFHCLSAGVYWDRFVIGSVGIVYLILEFILNQYYWSEY